MTTLAPEHRAQFERLRAEGPTVLAEWVRDHIRESVRLEFKPKSDPTISGLDPHDRSELARTICGFANTSGGIVGFGLEAKSARKGEPDELTRPLPIIDVKRCVGRIEAEMHEWHDPAVRGLEVFEIVTDEPTKAGVILIYVPASDGAPHRVVASNVDPGVGDHYFMRTASSTLVMPHAMLAALFARPQLRRAVLLLQRIEPGAKILVAGRKPRSPNALYVPDPGEFRRYSVESNMLVLGLLNRPTDLHIPLDDVEAVWETAGGVWCIRVSGFFELIVPTASPIGGRTEQTVVHYIPPGGQVFPEPKQFDE